MTQPGPRTALDVGELANYAFGPRTVLWWATMCMIVIEGTAFALVITSYLYLKGRVPHWPPGVGEPAMLWGTVNVLLMLVSVIPNELTKRAAERFDRQAVKLWISVCILFAVVFTVVRFLEFSTLNVRWDTNAYGSVTWVLLGFHTVHLLTDFADTIVLAIIMFVGPVDEHRFVDVSENSFYWYFVVISWVPIYAVLYFAPRLV